MTETMTAPAPAAKRPPRAGADAGEPSMILTFRLQDERFALRVDHVNEILDPIAQTPVPKAPAHVPALLNVRGAVVPLFDIRHRLGIERGPLQDTARVVVLDLEISGEMTRLAIPVDAVENVVENDPGRIQPVPELGARWPQTLIEGVAYHGEDLVVLLDVDALFTVDE